METFKTQGTCSVEIQFEIKDGIVTYAKFVRGCAGNTQGVAKLAIGMKVDDVIEKLDGIQCRGGTSCPDQFAKALKEWKATHAE